MSDIFGGIFDSLSSGIDDVFSGDAPLSTYATLGKDIIGIGSALGATGSNMTDKGESTAYKGLKLASALENHTMSPLKEFKNASPIHTRDDFKAAESVDPFTLEQEWNTRLSKYAGIVRATGVQQ